MLQLSARTTVRVLLKLMALALFFTLFASMRTAHAQEAVIKDQAFEDKKPESVEPKKSPEKSAEKSNEKNNELVPPPLADGFDGAALKDLTQINPGSGSVVITSKPEQIGVIEPKNKLIRAKAEQNCQPVSAARISNPVNVKALKAALAKIAKHDSKQLFGEMVIDWEVARDATKFGKGALEGFKKQYRALLAEASAEVSGPFADDNKRFAKLQNLIAKKFNQYCIGANQMVDYFTGKGCNDQNVSTSKLYTSLVYDLKLKPAADREFAILLCNDAVKPVLVNNKGGYIDLTSGQVAKSNSCHILDANLAITNQIEKDLEPVTSCTVAAKVSEGTGTKGSIAAPKLKHAPAKEKPKGVKAK